MTSGKKKLNNFDCSVVFRYISISDRIIKLLHDHINVIIKYDQITVVIFIRNQITTQVFLPIMFIHNLMYLVFFCMI